MTGWTHAFLSSKFLYEDPQLMAVCGLIQKRRSLRFVLADFCGGFSTYLWHYHYVYGW